MAANLQSGKFYFATSTFDNADLVLWGLPWDCTASYRSGSRFAPSALRQAFEAVESFSPYRQKDLQALKIHDAGNLELPFGDTAQAIALVRSQIEKFARQGKKTITIGGEHLLSYPIIEHFHQLHGPRLHVLHVDAHCDLRDEYLGVKLSHATVMRLIQKLIGAENTSHFFVRSGSMEEWQLLNEAPHVHCPRYPCGSANINDIDLTYLKGSKLYLSVDIDVFDPSVAPGTGVPDAGGIFFHDYVAFLDLLNGYEIVGFDLMELAPDADPSGASAVLTAKVLRETILRMT